MARAVDRVSGVIEGRIEIGQIDTGTWQELPTTLEVEQLASRIDDAALPAGDYALRVSATDRARNQATSDRLADGQLMRVRLPLRVETQIRAGVVQKRKVRRFVRRAGKRRAVKRTIKVLVRETQVRFGQRVRLAGQLTGTDGSPVPNATLNVYATTRSGSEQHLATLRRPLYCPGAVRRDRGSA